MNSIVNVSIILYRKIYTTCVKIKKDAVLFAFKDLFAYHAKLYCYPSLLSPMERIIKHAKRGFSTFSLAALSMNILLGSALALLPVVPAVSYAAITCNGLTATITGSGVINGTAGDDVIVGSGGVDTITGNGGNDTICSLGGNDTVTTGTGNDWIDAGDGTNTVIASSGNNTIFGGSGNDTVTTGDGDDVIDVGNGTNDVTAGSGTNTITGGSGNDTVITGNGNDTIDVGDGTNNVTAGNGANSITGGSGNDTVTSGDGDDVISVGNGTNNITAGNGNNTVTGGSGNDTVVTGSGNDVINVGNGTNNVHAGDGNDVIKGGAGNDTFYGEGGVDYGDTGNNGTDNMYTVEASGNQGIVTIVKNTTPDTPADSFDFTGGLGTFSLNGEDSETFVALASVGGISYNVVESATAGWALDSIVCTTDTGTSGNVGTSTATIMLNTADVLTCTFTNVSAPLPTVKVTIAKYINGVLATAVNTNSAAFSMHAIYPGGQGDYNLSTTGFNNPTAYMATTSDMPSGSDYSTYENPITPCTEAFPFDFVGYSTGDSLVEAAGATVSMTVPAFTGLTSDKFVIVWNKTCPPAPTHVSPADGSMLTSAQLDKIDWSDITSDPAMPISYYYQSAINPATNPDGSFVSPAYTSAALSASEIPTLGTPNGTYYWHVRAVDAAGNSSVWSTPWSVTVAPAPKLTVNLTIINDNGGTKTSADVTLTVDAVTVSDGIQAEYAAGAHTVAGTSLTGYTKVIGGNCASDGSITLALSDVKSCSVTYDDIAPKLTVTKVVINDNSGSLLNVNVPLFVDGNSVTTGVENTFDAGVHVVTETNEAGYDFLFTGDCSSTGSIVLQPGDVKTCVVTNDDQPATLIVYKQVINDDGGTRAASDFSIQVSGNAANPGAFPGDQSGTVVTLNAGTYSVSETAVTGYTGSFGEDCSGVMLPGDSKTCTVTNDDQPGTLTVIKHVINDDGGTLTAGNFSLSVNEMEPFSGNESGTVLFVNAGAYTVTEPDNTLYTESMSESCSGTITNGQSIVCTVTNDDIFQPIESFNNDEGIPDEGNDGQNGARRGNGTNRLGAVVSFVSGLRGLNGSVAPAAFGGSSDTPLSSEEKSYLCSIQKALPRTYTIGLLTWIAEQLAPLMNRPIGLLFSVLSDPMCDAPAEAKAVVAQAIAVPLDESGVPVSDNDLWNKCIRNERIFLEDVRNNIEITPEDAHRRVLPRDCGSYHTGKNWLFPDLNIHFTWDGTKKVAVFPKGYTGAKPVKVVQNQAQ